MIYIDIRESDETIEAFQRADPEIQVTTLESGDIVQGNYAIEHKKPEDFWASLKDGRLFKQIEVMNKNFDGSAILVSGNPDTILYNNVGIGTVASCIVRGTPVIFCKDLTLTVKLSLVLLEKWNDNKDRTFNPSINQKLYRDPQLNIVTGIPTIQAVLGDAILDHFGTIKAICEATSSDLQKVPGIGKKKAQKIFNTLNTPRW